VVLRLMGLLSAPYALESGPVVLSASMGLAWYPDDACDADTLQSHTRNALQVAKSRGGNQCCQFTSDLLLAAQAKARMVRDMRLAIAEQQFVLFFQPIVDIVTGEIHKAEALLRWHHPELGVVSPADFIPLAEETGMIVEIGNWVFEEAARWAKRWRETDPQFQVSINKSPAQFDPTGHGTRAWLDYLTELELPGEAIVIEITEGLLLKSEPHVAQTMAAYRAAGIQLAIDDFGTGYSALSYLKKFDIDYLKIDQSFTRNLGADLSDLALCEAIVVMAHRLGLQVVAEGVETQAQQQLLSDMGCDLAQGYLFAKPMGPQAFEQVLAANARG
jgi:EAL domain-containing protein (putative c-di-GMP-specific phosphodiesterase class I)